MTLTDGIWMKRDAWMVRHFCSMEADCAATLRLGGYRRPKLYRHLEEITDITPRKLSVYVFFKNLEAKLKITH